MSDDADLVRAAQAGDAMAMHELLARLEPAVGRWCGPIALHDGPDAAQEALVSIFQKLGQLREPAALWGWARRIAVRAAIRLARQRQAIPPMPADWFAGIPAPEEPELHTDITAVLERLAPEHRAVLVLRGIEGLTETEIAEVLDVPSGTVRSRLFRARRRFRQEWQR
ncbi:RNA polymerase sigma factor [Phytoactinopolyspora mesophila]|uniref:Sigma-70 family RNA polymerase sigma factor n=1 Tax=Phytoactinopolyspora mesophila TaxID=2650750 RepID=A0A7K3M0W9_9ACTN|nr:RNA polymerase sigma factor [Phytoactinopolyspora mesophila]NDL56919.1 sigma-70 family RNA polymerase sigma factor [Phytoactinopolyspora mesophila]